MIDKELILKDALTTAVTATESGDAVPVSEGNTRLRCNITEIKTSAGNETCNLKLEQSADGLTNWEEVVSRDIAAAGEEELTGKIDKKYVRVTYTLGGTSPSVKFIAHLIPSDMM
jgi:hypothetical protein